jgi:hypothetical protein
MKMGTANLISPTGFNAAIGVVSFESNTQLKSNSEPGIWQRCHQRKKTRGCGGFEAVSPLSLVNRQKEKYAGEKQNRNQTIERRNPCKLNNQ